MTESLSLPSAGLGRAPLHPRGPGAPRTLLVLGFLAAAGLRPAFPASAAAPGAAASGGLRIIVFGAHPDDPEVDVDAELTLFVTLVEPEVGIELQLLGPFEKIFQTVKGIIDAAKDLCF